MKIALFDPYTPKFTGDIVRWWQTHGHEVRVDRYYDPELVKWADVVWFDTCDNNLKCAMYPDKNDPTQQGWDLHEMDLTNKKLIVRVIDIEVWSGHNLNVDWDLVDDIIFIAPHIKELVARGHNWKPEYEEKVRIIPCGVDLDRFTFKERSPGFNIGIVSEIWGSKGSDLVLQVALKLKSIDSRYNIQWLGKWAEYNWDEAYIRSFIERNQLSITFVDWVESVDDFLEDKNYLLHCSKKEAFSYATAEAMAKGIKPILHHFYGAEDLWPDMTWQSIDGAIGKIIDEYYDSRTYPRYLIERGYTLPQMMAKIDEVINA